jgi:hypothetical protein
MKNKKAKMFDLTKLKQADIFCILRSVVDVPGCKIKIIKKKLNRKNSTASK